MGLASGGAGGDGERIETLVSAMVAGAGAAVGLFTRCGGLMLEARVTGAVVGWTGIVPGVVMNLGTSTSAALAGCGGVVGRERPRTSRGRVWVVLLSPCSMASPRLRSRWRWRSLGVHRRGGRGGASGLLGMGSSAAFTDLAIAGSGGI